MKAPSERGVIGAWAYAARTELDLSVEQVAERVAARGQAVSPATIRGIESGAKKPGARLLRLLAQALESTPPGSSAPVVDAQPDVVGLVEAVTAAMLVQARALTDLQADLIAARDAAADERLAMTRMLARLEAQLAELQPRGRRRAGAAVQGSGH